jgi:O-antigen/teichoic acid export membrane protein
MASTAGAVHRLARPVRRALQNDFLRHSALVFGASMATNVLNYLFNFALSRRLGVEGFATLSSLTSGVMILSIPATILTLVVVKYAATFHAAGDAPRIRRLSNVLLKWIFVAAAVVVLLGELFRGAIGHFLNIPSYETISLALLVTALGFITPTLRGVLQGEQDFLRYSLSLVFESLLKVLFAVALVYAGYRVEGAMLGWVLGIACAMAYTVWAVLKKHGAPGKTARLNLDLRRLAQTTVGVALATGFLTTISFIDVLLVKHYFDARQAGFYAAVNLSGKIVLFLVGFVPAIVLPKAVAKVERGEDATNLLLRAGVITLLMSGATLAVFGLAPSLILRLLAGRAFISAAPFVFQYDAAMALLALLTLVVNYKIGLHRYDFLFWLGGVLALEVTAIALWHQSLWDVIHVLLVGNVIAVIMCGYNAARTPEAAVYSANS